MNGAEWFAESGGTDYKIVYHCRRRIFSGRSEFQQIDIIETHEYGRMLLLDGVAQSSEKDEFIYHDVMVHPAMLTHPRPEKVCIIGGAEGATLREVLRHPSMTRVVMVDIDDQLVGLCREHLPDWSGGAYDDPRLELHFGDGRSFLENLDETFDVILVDLSDPVPESPAVFLFTREFYQVIKDRLTPGGAACFQGESLKPWRMEMHARMMHTLNSLFPVVAAYPYLMPCFHELHAMILVSRDADPRDIDLGARARERGLVLRYLTPKYIQGIFNMPGFTEEAYRNHPDILTDENHLVVTSL